MNPPFASTYLPILAQTAPWEQSATTDTPAPPVQHGLTFSDFKGGLRAYHSGESRDSATRSGLLAVVAVVIIVGAFLHFRQRRKQAGPPDNDIRLGRDICRIAGLSFSARLLLRWVSRSEGVPVAALVVSSAAFQSSLAQWSARPTFGPIRRWGSLRLRTATRRLFIA